jgi:hypothetical protein
LVVKSVCWGVFLHNAQNENWKPFWLERESFPSLSQSKNIQDTFSCR